MKEKLKGYGKINGVLMELKNEAMKPKHWKELLGKMKISQDYNELTLKQLWEEDLFKHEKVINEILATARGEMIL